MEDIDKIRKKVIEYCIRNRDAVILFSTMNDEDREHVYDLATSVVLTRDGILKGGDFVQAIVRNDLESAVGRGDHIAMRALQLFVLVKLWFNINE